MKFTKMHGAGNDYIYIDARGLDEDWPSLSRVMSHRNFGVGGDGLILIQESDIADLKMAMFNSDGSQGEMCGNGIRCFAKYALERGIAPHSDAGLTVGDAWRGCAPFILPSRTAASPGPGWLWARRGLEPREIPVILDPEAGKTEAPGHSLPAQRRRGAVGLDLRVYGQPPRCYIPPGAGGRLSPCIPLALKWSIIRCFPAGSISKWSTSERMARVAARVWERGSGETMACGTGACAIAVAARLEGLNQGSLEVKLPGGALTIEWDGEGEVFMEGPAEEVFSGEWQTR